MPIVVSKAAQRLGDEIGAQGNLYLLALIECGLHSGIPRCCVTFYVTAWCPMWDANAFDLLADYRQLLDRRRCGFVACPACLLAGKRLMLKRCTCYRQRTVRLAA